MKDFTAREWRSERCINNYTKYNQLMQYDMRLLKTYLLLLFVFLVPSTSMAITAQEAYQQGIEYAKSGNFRSALPEFELASQLGKRSAALTYNLAVSYYRLGLFNEAYAAFLSLRNHPKLAGVAIYNLGLTREKQQRFDQAKALFQEVLSTSNDPNLQELSEDALRGLGKKVQLKEQRKRKRVKTTSLWHGLVSVNFAHDDNIRLDSDTAEKAGSGIEADLTASGYLTGNRRNGFRLSGRINRLYYFKEAYVNPQSTTVGGSNTSDFNSNFAQFVASYDVRKFSWYNRISAIASSSELDKKTYQVATGYELRTEQNFVGLVKLRFRFRYRHITTDPLYDYVAGNNKRFRIDIQLANYNKKRSGKKLRLSYIYEKNHRHSDNYSPDRTYLRMLTNAPLGRSAQLKLAIGYRFSTYDRYRHPVNGVQERSDDRTRIRLELDYKLVQAWHLLAGAVHTRNDSDAGSLFVYSQNVFYTGVRWFY